MAVFGMWQLMAAAVAPIASLAWFGAYNRVGGAVLVTGSVFNELREIHAEQQQAGAGHSAGHSEAEIEAGLRAWRTTLERSGLFPRLVRVFDEGTDPDAAEMRDERFEFGLGCVLDGVAVRLPS